MINGFSRFAFDVNVRPCNAAVFKGRHGFEERWSKSE
jgi:hypothetical protein